MGISKAAEQKMNSVQVTYDGHKQKVTALCQCGWSYTDTRMNSSEVHRQAIEHTPCTKLPSAPSPAGAKKSLSEVLEELCPGVGRRNHPAWATPLPPEPPLPEPMMTTDEDAVPEGAPAEEDWFPYPVAAPIAPAAVSETILLGFKPSRVVNRAAGIIGFRSADETGNTLELFLRAKPSAEGDGWIAVTERLNKALDLLDRVAEDEQPAPDANWNREYYELRGYHMIMTEEGWQPGAAKDELVAEYGAEHILDEVNAPAPPSGQGEVK